MPHVILAYRCRIDQIRIYQIRIYQSRIDRVDQIDLYGPEIAVSLLIDQYNCVVLQYICVVLQLYYTLS